MRNRFGCFSRFVPVLAALGIFPFVACTKLDKAPAPSQETQVSPPVTTTSTTAIPTPTPLPTPSTVPPMGPDTSFGNGGKSIIAVSQKKDIGRGIGRTPDGRLIVGGESHNGGNFDFALVRLDAHGNLDRTFGNDQGTPQTGIVTTDVSGGDDEVAGVAVLSDGRILVAGTAANGSNTDFAFARYKATGTADTSMAKTTVNFPANKNDAAKAIAVNPNDGSVVIVGHSYGTSGASEFAMVRFTASGQLDTTFGSGGNATFQTAIGGKVTTRFNLGRNQGANAVFIQSDGKIVVAGWALNGTHNDFAVARYDAAGRLDAGFGNQGLVTTDFGQSLDDAAAAVMVHSSGAIVVGGSAKSRDNSDFALARYLADGKPDTSFNGNGRAATHFQGDDFITGLALVGNTVVAGGYGLSGTVYNFAFARYSWSGAADTAGLGTDGRLTLSFGPGLNSYGRAVYGTGDAVYLVGETYTGGTQFDFAIAKLK